MGKLEYQRDLLSSVISGELDQMKSKFAFWQVPGVKAGTLWQNEKPLTLEQALKMVDTNDPEVQQGELGLLLGIGWEFIWGQEPPQIVKELREVVREKAKCGLEMTEHEQLWYRLICADTDMF